jgi:tetraacyldisaccharide 4'-kinase
MRAPEFWHGGDSLAATLLSPAGALYGAVGRWRRHAVTPARVGVPVICVGNVVAGGAGKTPVALALAARIPGAWCLTRGYGGRARAAQRVDPARDTAAEVGDEALLLARAAPTVVAADRLAGARIAVAQGARAIVMDDGLQNPALAKDLSLLVVDAAYGFGNGQVMPAGPLREPVAEAMARADAVVWLAGDEPARPGLDPASWGRPVIAARLLPRPDALRLHGRRVLGFAGIGRPAKFFATLQALGAEVVEAVGFADHHAYGEDEVMALIERAVALEAVPVTTAKDAVRLPAGARGMVEVVEVAIEFATPDALDALIATAVNAQQS